VKEHKMEHYNGRIVAIDASMAIYQFLVRANLVCLCLCLCVYQPCAPALFVCPWALPSRRRNA